MTKSRDTADVRNLADTNATDVLNLENASRYKNYIDNPSMAISQENGDGPNTLTDGYVADRWRVLNSTGTGAISAEISSLNNYKTSKLTATTAVTDLTTTKVVGLVHFFEAQDVYHLNGKEVTISFKVNTNWTGNLAVVIQNHDASKAYVTDCAVTSGENDCSVTLTLEADTVDAADNGVGLRLLVGGNNEADRQTGTIGSWTAGNLYCSTSSTQWSKTLNNFVEFTEVQLVEGDTAPKFQPNSYQEDLAKCQRYWRKSYDQDVSVGTTTTIGAHAFRAVNTFHVETIQFPAMRSNPTPTIYSTNSGSSGNVYDVSNTADRAVSSTATGETSLIVIINTTVANADTRFQYVLDARL